jgi:hypothetical protein
MNYSIQQQKTSLKSSKKGQADLSDVFGYDVSLIAKDLRTTIVVSGFLIGVLVFLAWYLPIGVLSS